MTESEMIIAIKSGGRQQDIALQALYRKAAEFRRFYIQHGATKHKADDLIQETIIKIFKGAASFTGNAGFGNESANAWMWAIARNEFLSSVRGNKKVGIPIDGDGLSDGEAAELEAELAKVNSERVADRSAEACVAAGIEKFAAVYPNHAKVLMMQMDGLDIASITSLIGRASVGATKVFMVSCRNKLAPFISHCLPLLKP